MDRIKHDVMQNTQEWLDLRNRLITASTFSDYFMAPSTAGFKKAISRVAFERCNVQMDNWGGNAGTDRGHELEVIGKEYYQEATLETIKEGNFWTYGDWIGASPDGMLNSNGIWEHKGKVEVYTMLESYKLFDKGIRLTEKSNKKHFWQVHFQLYVTGRKYCIYQIGSEGFKPLIERIESSPIINLRIKQKLEEVIPMIKEQIKIIEKYKF